MSLPQNHMFLTETTVSRVPPQLLPTSFPGVSDKYVHIVVMVLEGKFIHAWEWVICLYISLWDD